MSKNQFPDRLLCIRLEAGDRELCLGHGFPIGAWGVYTNNNGKLELLDDAAGQEEVSSSISRLLKLDSDVTGNQLFVAHYAQGSKKGYGFLSEHYATHLRSLISSDPSFASCLSVQGLKTTKHVVFLGKGRNPIPKLWQMANVVKPENVELADYYHSYIDLNLDKIKPRGDYLIETAPMHELVVDARLKNGGVQISRDTKPIVGLGDYVFLSNERQVNGGLLLNYRAPKIHVSVPNELRDSIVSEVLGLLHCHDVSQIKFAAFDRWHLFNTPSPTNSQLGKTIVCYPSVDTKLDELSDDLQRINNHYFSDDLKISSVNSDHHLGGFLNYRFDYIDIELLKTPLENIENPVRQLLVKEILKQIKTQHPKVDLGQYLDTKQENGFLYLSAALINAVAQKLQRNWYIDPANPFQLEDPYEVDFIKYQMGIDESHTELNQVLQSSGSNGLQASYLLLLAVSLTADITPDQRQLVCLHVQQNKEELNADTLIDKMPLRLLKLRQKQSLKQKVSSLAQMRGTQTMSKQGMKLI